ncbi:MAG: DUF1844 domain-containing protein [Chthonomonadaceae bacterium]|nr:DUF1844 domain-containing protein [Chthonomonadaceae bacterium]
MSTPGEGRAPVDVQSVVVMTIDQFAALAWQKMGLQPDFMSGQISQDLGQCKLAIDAAAALVPLIEASLDEGDRRQVQNLVRDLRINYMERAK